MKKVLFVVTALEVGGIETYLLRFLNFAEKDFDAYVYCKSGRDGVLEEKYKKLGATIIKNKFNYLSVSDSVKLYRFLRKEKFDAVCDFTGDFSGLFLLVSKLANIERRLTFHRESKYQFNPTKFKMRYARFMNFLVKKSATKVLSNSQTALNEFHPGWKDNNDFYEVIYNGIPFFPKIGLEKKEKIRVDLVIPKDAFLIGHVGRYTPAKNHQQIIKVAKVMLEKYPNVYFLLCGRDVNAGLEKEVTRLGLNNRIIMPGSRDDISEILQCLNAFYFPSLNEGQPNALLEAMSLGIPTVASNIESIKESFPEKFSNYLIDPNDSENAIGLLSSLIEEQSIFPSKEIADWTKENFDTKEQFEKFNKQLMGV